VKRYQESISPDKKAQVLVINAAEQKFIDDHSHQRKKLKYYAMILMHTGNNASLFLLRKRSKFYKLMLMHIKRNKILFHLMT
jgi:hypothetical protein